MKSKPQKKRIHGLSRTEKLLQASIRQDLHIRNLTDRLDAWERRTHEFSWDGNYQDGDIIRDQSGKLFVVRNLP